MSFAIQCKVPLVNVHMLCSLMACQATVATQVQAERTTSRLVHPTSAITPDGRSSGGAPGRPPGAWRNVAIIRPNVATHTTSVTQVRLAVSEQRRARSFPARRPGERPADQHRAERQAQYAQQACQIVESRLVEIELRRRRLTESSDRQQDQAQPARRGLLPAI